MPNAPHGVKLMEPHQHAAFALYEARLIGKQELLAMLKVYDLVDQLLLHTPEALKLLKYKDSLKIDLTCNSK